MAFLFRPGGPQIGAAGAPALTAGVTAMIGSGAAAPADISIVSDPVQRVLRREGIAPIAIGGPASAPPCGGGRARHDGGRFRV